MKITWIRPSPYYGILLYYSYLLPYPKEEEPYMMRNNDDVWIQTYSGLKFHIFHPSPEEVSLRDIAKALAQSCRFNGHTTQFYSVAEHCTIVAEALIQIGVESPDMILQALLHDSAEAYISDIPKPVKTHLSPEMMQIENRILSVIMSKYSLPFPIHTTIQATDVAILLVEKMTVLSHHVYWGWEDEGHIINHPTINAILCSPPKIDMLPPNEAESRFLAMLYGYLGSSHS